jgi:hypothetical protein
VRRNPAVQIKRAVQLCWRKVQKRPDWCQRRIAHQQADAEFVDGTKDRIGGPGRRGVERDGARIDAVDGPQSHGNVLQQHGAPCHQRQVEAAGGQP